MKYKNVHTSQVENWQEIQADGTIVMVSESGVRWSTSKAVTDVPFHSCHELMNEEE